MNAAVCVLVTVPTEQEERRQWQQQPKRFQVYSCRKCGHWEQAATALPHGSRALPLHELRGSSSLEQVLREIALHLRLEYVFWSHDVAGGQLQARFDLLQDERYERLLCTLQDWGIGDRPGTHVTAINCLETRVKLSTAVGRAATPAAETTATTEATAVPPEGQRLGWQRFMDSVRCRLNVNQVVRVVRRDATINFDFVVLLMAAAMLSCVGLVENSFLFLSSSMLISPLMGPIIAGIFGSVIGDRGLRWLGIRNELIGIVISVVTGFVFGVAICLCDLARFFVLAGGFTEEMLSRCDTHSLAIGLCTALVSGAAAAIGVLGGNTGSLVGVAISASLLPPAVNAGLLWSISICSRLFRVDGQLLQSLAKHQEYSQQLHIELFVCATVSMALTLLNVICVWLMGVIVLRIKEVAPAVQRDQQFWRHDVRLARQVALNDPELHSAIARLDTSERRRVDLEAPQYQHTWSPGTIRASKTKSCRARLRPEARSTCDGKDSGSSYHTVHGFQDFCITLHKLKQPQPTEEDDVSPVPVPSFVQLFNPPEQRGVPTVPQVSQFPSSSGLSNHRSLPDLRQPAQDSTSRSRAKLPRCVHWDEQQDPYRSSDPLRELESLPRQSGQVLLPLPLPDRQLQLLRSRSRESSEECEYDHEFNV